MPSVRTALAERGLGAARELLRIDRRAISTGLPVATTLAARPVPSRLVAARERGAQQLGRLGIARAAALSCDPRTVVVGERDHAARRRSARSACVATVSSRPA